MDATIAGDEVIVTNGISVNRFNSAPNHQFREYSTPEFNAGMRLASQAQRCPGPMRPRMCFLQLLDHRRHRKSQ